MLKPASDLFYCKWRRLMIVYSNDCMWYFHPLPKLPAPINFNFNPAKPSPSLTMQP